MNQRSWFCLLAAGLVMGALCVPVRAGLVTWHFEGVVTDIHDANGLLTGLVDPGSHFSASITFNPEAHDSSRSTAVGFYEDAITEASGTIGGVTFLFSGGSNWAGVFTDGHPEGPVDFFADLIETPNLSDRLGLWILALQGEALADDSLPLVPTFAGGVFDMHSEPGGLTMQGTLTSVVPEPGCLTLLVLAGGLLGRCRR